MGLLQPEAGLLFWMTLAFAVVFILLAKFGFPVILRSIDSRKEFIDSSLDAAREAERKLVGLRAEGDAILEKAARERTELLREAAATREQLLREARRKADEEGERIVAAARAKAEAEREAILQDARHHVCFGVPESIDANYAIAHLQRRADLGILCLEVDALQFGKQGVRNFRRFYVILVHTD